MRNFIDSFKGYALALQLAAVVATAVLVLSGLDWKYFEATRDPALFGVVIFAGAGGFLIPALMPAALFLFGQARKQAQLVELALLIVQAEIIAYLISIIYKAFTGRLQPNLVVGDVDISHAFHFGFLQNGIFWGWPSSHTIVAFAGAYVLARSVRSRFLRAAVITYAIIIGFGASIGFHWLSDVVAGALIGVAVASVVYTSRERFSAIGPLGLREE